MKTKMYTGLLVALLVLALSVSVFAGDYPSRPIKIIVPYGAGGGTDTITRILQKGLEKVLPVPVAVVNIGGGASVVGMRELMNADQDGYTMGINIINIWTNKALGTADFGPFEFEPIAATGEYNLVYVAGGNSRYSNLEDIAAQLKKEPNTVVEATNIGAITHFTTLAMQDELGVQIRLVHIGDGSSRIQNVIGGHVDTTIMGTNEAIPFYKSGEMKVLAIFGKNRVDAMPDVPTAIEQGVNVGSPVQYWTFMPKGTAQDKVDYMADALEKVMQDPEVLKKLNSLVINPVYLRGEELKTQIQAAGDEIMSIAEKHDLAK